MKTLSASLKCSVSHAEYEEEHNDINDMGRTRMERIDGIRTENKILHQLLRKAEISYTVSDISKAIGPMIDLVFISQFIGVRGVTVLGFVTPLIILFELIGTTMNSGARNKVSAMIGAGQVEEANRAFSGSLIMGGSFSALAAFLTAIFCSGICMILGARDPIKFFWYYLLSCTI